MGFNYGSSSQKFPSWTAPLTRWAFEGNTPNNIDPRGDGLMSDALMGSLLFPGYEAFGGLAGQVGNAQQAGAMTRQLGAEATNQGYGNLMALGSMGWGPLGQTQQIAGLVPNAMDASNYYLNRGVTPATQGSNVQGAMGAGQQVVDAALNAYRAMPAESYQRVVADALPEVRSSYSARGLGLSGEAARGEQDYIQRTRDDLYQKDVANQIAALGTGAAASGAAASQAIGAQQAAIQRGQLGLNASNSIPQQLGAFQNVAGAPLDYMAQVAQLQGAPLDFLSQGLGLQGQALNLPLQYQQALYNFTRQPQLDLLSALSGTQTPQSRNWNFGGGISGGKSGGGGGGGTN
jgi:hypothetical protein